MLHYKILVSTIDVIFKKKSYKSNKFKTWASTWHKEFELPDGSYFVLDIQGYFECCWNMKHWLIILKYKYILTKLKKELNLKLRLDTILSFENICLW